ncbi:MAG: glycosyltransferase [Lachnospiraceae bacterium]|nr:glycosyltransferase [Lachnospiraceae bacterium]
MKKVSLLVTVYNAEENLAATLQSIEEQVYQNIEVVIVDGGSTDGTVALIRQFENRTADRAGLSLRWVSEKDQGLYDAMNKAYRLSTGDIIAVCNDRLCEPEAVSSLAAAVEAGGEGCVGAHSDLVYVEGERIIRRWHMGEGKLSQGWMPGHPTLFLKREIYEKYGLYDTSYRCAADYEFMVRFLKDEKNRLAYVPRVLVAMFYGGTSNAGIRNYLVSFQEGYQALKRNGVGFPLWITLRRSIKVLFQFGRSAG